MISISITVIVNGFDLFQLADISEFLLTETLMFNVYATFNDFRIFIIGEYLQKK